MTKIICTIGPSSRSEEVLSCLEKKVDFFRINLSHTLKEEIEGIVKLLMKYSVPVIIDTEGKQVRTTNHEDIIFRDGSTVRIFNYEVPNNSENIYLNPAEAASHLKIGDKISLDFHSTLLSVTDNSTVDRGYIVSEVVNGGLVGDRKAVYVANPDIRLPRSLKKINSQLI